MNSIVIVYIKTHKITFIYSHYIICIAVLAIFHYYFFTGTK